MPQKNPMLERLRLQAELKYKNMIPMAQQMSFDAALIALGDVFGFGPKRAKEFAAKYVEIVDEMSDLINKDGISDKEIVYAKERIDERLRKVVGEDEFAEWDCRYTKVYTGSI